MDILSTMRIEFSAAKRRWLLIILLQVLSVVLGVRMIIDADCARLAVLSAIGVLIPAISICLRASAGHHYGLAERLRKMLLLKDGLGEHPAEIALLEIGAETAVLPSSDPKPLGAYFDSPLHHGPQRILHIAQEAAFYTRTLARTAARVCAVLSVGGIAGATVLLLIVVQTLSCPQGNPDLGRFTLAPNQVARIVGVLLAYFSGGLFADLWIGYHRLATAAERTFRDCERMGRAPNLRKGDLYTVLGDYDSAVAVAAPLPGFLYRIYRLRLHKAWTRTTGRSSRMGRFRTRKSR